MRLFDIFKKKSAKSELQKELMDLHKQKQKIKERQRKIEEELKRRYGN